MMTLMTSCATLGLGELGESEPVVSNGCEWVEPIYLSEATIKALRELAQTNPEVQQDRINLATHNKNYEEFCPAEE